MQKRREKRWKKESESWEDLAGVNARRLIDWHFISCLTRLHFTNGETGTHVKTHTRLTVFLYTEMSCITLHSIFLFSNNNNNRIQKRKSRYFTISSLRHELAPTRTFKWPGRNRVQHIERLITCNMSWNVGHNLRLCHWFYSKSSLP